MRKLSTRGVYELSLAWLVAVVLTAAPCQAADVWLVVRPVTVTMPDGVPVPMWGFAEAQAGFTNIGAATVPVPYLRVPPGDSTLTIHLRNELTGHPVSLVIPGQTAVLNPVRTGPDAKGRTRVTSFTNETAPNGGEGVYTWPSLRPGTYAYQSGTHVQIQGPMGLYGMVSADAAPGQAYPGVFYDNEAALVYSEIDPVLNAAVADGSYGTPAHPSSIDYMPTYFLINGQPYPAAAAILDHPMQSGELVLLRFYNAGLGPHVPTLNGMSMDQVANDGNVLPFPKLAEPFVFLPAGKVADALVATSKPGTYALYDRHLALTNAGASPGGMLTHLSVAPITGWFQVAATSDDAEEKPSGSVKLTSSDLEMSYDKKLQTVGIRFPGVTIPKGASISKAYIQFQVDEKTKDATPVTITIRGEAIGDAPAFTSATGNISSRARTAAFVEWSPPAWTAIGAAGLQQRTADISSVVQEVVNLGSWAPGNAMVMIITGANTAKSRSRIAESYDGDKAGAPSLHVEYGLAPPTTTPTLPPTTITTTSTTWASVTTTTGQPATTSSTSSTTTTTAGSTTTLVPGGSAWAQVAASSDDAEEKPSGSMKLTSSDLEMSYDKSLQTVGIRFPGVTIPKGASISKAYIQFQVDEKTKDATPVTITIRGEAIGDAPPFTTATGDISSRTATTASVPWSPPAWTTVGAAGLEQQTADISSVIEEIVNLGGWAPGNALAVIITGTNTVKSQSRIAESYDGDKAGAPSLHVEYNMGASGG